MSNMRRLDPASVPLSDESFIAEPNLQERGVPKLLGSFNVDTLVEAELTLSLCA